MALRSDTPRRRRSPINTGINESDRAAVVGEFARLTVIPEAQGVPVANDMVRQLVEGHEAVCRTARAAFPAAEGASDQVTMDLLTQRLEFHEKTAWMLRSLLDEGKR